MNPIDRDLMTYECVAIPDDNTPEHIISRSLREIVANLPAGAPIPDSEGFRCFLTSLRYFIPTVIGEIHREMQGQALDEVLPAVARKTGNDEAEILGLCCFLSDQSLAAVHLQLQVAASEDEISWVCIDSLGTGIIEPWD